MVTKTLVIGIAMVSSGSILLLLSAFFLFTVRDYNSILFTVEPYVLILPYGHFLNTLLYAGVLLTVIGLFIVEKGKRKDNSQLNKRKSEYS